jgi:exonuclease SbcC
MIKKIEIKNFLSHKKTNIEFSPGVNIIVGGTDSGKSAIVHALKWIINNRPSGDSFRSNWGGDTSVKIVTEDFSLVRTKTDKENIYSLEGGPEDVLFKAFKTTVPEEVQKALNMNEINIKSQDDSHFLLSKTSGEVVQHFNNIAHLNKIDSGRLCIQRQMGILKANIHAGTVSLSGYREDLKQYLNLDIVEGLINTLDRLEKQHRKKVSQVQIMTQIILDVRAVDKKIEAESKLISAEFLVNKILAYSQEIAYIGSKNALLKKLHSDIVDIQKETKQLEASVKAESLVSSLININLDLDTQSRFLDQLQVLINYIERIIKEEKKLKKDLLRLEKEFHKNIGEVCPLCGEKITK